MATSTCNLSCDICCKEVNILKMPECDHTFCLTCLEDLVDNKPGKNHINCPLCKRQIEVPDGGVKECASNLHIQGKSRCLEHPLKEVEFYCKNCSKVVCSKCAVIIHRDHTCVDLDIEETKFDIANELKSLLQSLIYSICELGKYSDMLKDMLLDVEDAAQIATSTVDNQVQKFCFEIIQIGEEAKCVIMETLNKDKTQLENLMNNAHMLNDELNNCVRTSRILLEDTSIVKVVDMIAKVRTLNEESDCTILDTSVPTLRFPCFSEAVPDEPVFTLDQLGSLEMLEQADFVAIRSQRNQRRLDEPSDDSPITGSISSSSNSNPAYKLEVLDKRSSLPTYQDQLYAGSDTVSNQADTASISPTTKRSTTEELGEELGERNTSSNYPNQQFAGSDTISKQSDTERISLATKMGPEVPVVPPNERSSSSDSVSKHTDTTNISPATEIGPQELEKILDERSPSCDTVSKQTDATNILTATIIGPEEHGGTLSERWSSCDTVSKQTDTTNISPGTKMGPEEHASKQTDTTNSSPTTRRLDDHSATPDSQNHVYSTFGNVSKKNDTTTAKRDPADEQSTLSIYQNQLFVGFKTASTTNNDPEELEKASDEPRSTSPTDLSQLFVGSDTASTANSDPEELEKASDEPRSTSPTYKNHLFVQPDGASEQAIKQWSALEEKLGVDESSFITTLNLNQINQTTFYSPDIQIVQGLTWRIAARKRIRNWKTTLDVYLLLTKDENKAVRICTVDFIVVLMNFKDKNQSVTEHRGGEFIPGGTLGGSLVNDFINWERLTNPTNGYIDELNNFKLKFTLNIIKIDA